eukprot:5038171-Heterocapsa_arctica.AAC.1
MARLASCVSGATEHSATQGSAAQCSARQCNAAEQWFVIQCNDQRCSAQECDMICRPCCAMRWFDATWCPEVEVA